MILKSLNWQQIYHPLAMICLYAPPEDWALLMFILLQSLVLDWMDVGVSDSIVKKILHVQQKCASEEKRSNII